MVPPPTPGGRHMQFPATLMISHFHKLLPALQKLLTIKHDWHIVGILNYTIL